MTKQSIASVSEFDNSYFDSLVSDARRGDTRASAACLYVFGHSLSKQRQPNSALAQYVGECLVNAAVTAATRRGPDGEKLKSEKIATATAKALGLIAPRRGPKTARLKPIRRRLDLVALVIHFHDLECPLTRDENGAFRRAAEVGGSKPSTVEAAYYDFKKKGYLEATDFKNTMHIRAMSLISASRK